MAAPLFLCEPEHCGTSASPVRMQIFSSVIESDGWVVLACHGDVWTKQHVTPICTGARVGEAPVILSAVRAGWTQRGEKISSQRSFNEELVYEMHHKEMLSMLLLL